MPCNWCSNGKKTPKPNPQAGIQGGILEQESSIDMSNIAIFNSSSKKADRVGIKLNEDGSKVRILNQQVKRLNNDTFKRTLH